MNKFLPYLLSLCFIFLKGSSLSYAQDKENSIWISPRSVYTSDSFVKIDFNDGLNFSHIKKIKWSSNTHFSCRTASVADQEGNLLFYTQDYRLVNRNNQEMPHTFWHDTLAISLTGDNPNYFILKRPGDNQQYFVIFVSSSFSFAAPPIVINYSIVDMSLDGGLGDLVQDSIDISIIPEKGLFNNVAGQIVTTIKGNCNEYWLLLLARELENRNITEYLLYAYKITQDGIIPEPTITKLDEEYYSFEVTPNNKEIIFTRKDVLDLYDFNPTTGALSNKVQIEGENEYVIGAKQIKFDRYGECLFKLDDNLYIYQFQDNNYKEVTSIFEINAKQYNIYDVRVGPDNNLYLIYDGYGANKLGVLRKEKDDWMLDFKTNMQSAGFRYFPNPNLTWHSGDIPRGSQQKIVCSPQDSIRLKGEYNAQYFVWSTGDTTETIYGKPGNTYWVQSYLCDAVYYDTFVVRMPTPEETGIETLNTNVCAGERILLNPKNEEGKKYNWSNDRSQIISDQKEAETNIYYTNAKVYLEETDQYGCVHKDSLQFTTRPCCELLIPNSFSPNGDGLNDRFSVVIEADKRIELFHIYDRWGKLVFKSESAYDTWDGTYLGQPLPTGVYYFVLQYRCYEQTPELKTIKGDVSLIR